MIRVGVVGSRSFPNEDLVRRLVRSLPRDWTVISGGADGPDSWAVDEAKALGVDHLEILPDWKLYSNQAGFIRNTAIVQNSNIIIAFMETLNPTNGTTDTIKKAAQMGLIIYTISNDTGLDRCLGQIL